MAAHDLEQLEPGEARHDHVADHEVELGGFEQLQRLLGALPTGRRMAGRLEDLHDEPADHVLVVDHEDAAHAGVSFAMGRRSVNDAPRPNSEAAVRSRRATRRSRG